MSPFRCTKIKEVENDLLGPLTKVITLKLVLYIVPISSEDVACAMRAQPRNGRNVTVDVLISPVVS